MSDTAALVALVVAAVALFIALAQLTQQLLATGYVIRKCDRIVTGGLTKGGTRLWHWRQFRFTVKYQAVVFKLPNSVYSGLGISPTVQVDSPSKDIWDRAVETRPQRTSAQGCWVSLVQDMVEFSCLNAKDICSKEESGDRIPEDLTVAPMRVDAITVLLICIAMGMQVFKYSPTTGEITLAGGVGSISSSVHPILGGLLHYNVFSNQPTIGHEAAKRHGRALRLGYGVWANAVFGRFRDRNYRRESVLLEELMSRKIPILRQNGRPDSPEANDIDTIRGAACFMAFGHVDVSESVPPSVVRRWASHFAETIVKAHHVEIIKNKSNISFITPSNLDSIRSLKVSSPHFQRQLSELSQIYMQLGSENPKASIMPQDQHVVETLPCWAGGNWEKLAFGDRDPSSYCQPLMLWNMICLVDYYLRQLNMVVPKVRGDIVQSWIDSIVAKSIRPLSAVDGPSFRITTTVVRTWPFTFYSACEEILNDLETSNLLDQVWGNGGDYIKHCVEMERLGVQNRPDQIVLIRRIITLRAEFSILRSAYYTVMMRAAHPLGPGLVEGCNIETALAYMA